MRTHMMNPGIRAIARMVMTGMLAGALLMGCQQPDTSPSPGMGDPYPAPMNDPQISVLSPDLQQWIAFHPATVVHHDERPMEVQVPMRNLTNNQYLVDYRFIFHDRNGMEVTPVMGWKMQSLEPKQTVRLAAGALDTKAVNYRLEVKWSR